MIDIPEPTRLFKLLLEFDEGENLINNSVEMLWHFYSDALDSDALRDRMAIIEDSAGHDKAKWTSPQMADFMVLGMKSSEKLAEIAEERIWKLVDIHRVFYQPDEKPDIEKLIVYLHLLATKALILIRHGRPEEDSRHDLLEVWRIVNFLKPEMICDEQNLLGGLVSVKLVGAVFSEYVSNCQRADGNYESALNSIAEGLRLLDWSNTQFREAVESAEVERSEDGAYLLREASPLLLWWVTLAETVSLPNIINLDPDKAEDIFEKLKSQTSLADSSQVARDCRILETYAPWIEDNTDWDEEDWTAHWHQSLGWAQGRFGPNEFLAMEDRRGYDDSVARLKKYFFGEYWDQLPERAKRSLVDADRGWLSGYGGRPEAVLNSLKIATEETIFHLIWRPVFDAVHSGTSHNLGVLNLLNIERKLRDDGHEPDLRNFEQMLRVRGFDQLTKAIGVVGNRESAQFLSRELPQALRSLRSARREAEHGLNRLWEDSEIASVFKRFVGVGTPGILPKLASLSGHRHQKPTD